MRNSVLVVISFIALSLVAGRAEADASAKQYAEGLFRAIHQGNMQQAQGYMVTRPEANAYWRNFRASPQAHDRYRQSVWKEMVEHRNELLRYQKRGVDIRYLGVDVQNANAVSGGNLLRPTVIVTARPVYQIEGKGRVYGPWLKFMKVASYWRISWFID